MKILNDKFCAMVQKRINAQFLHCLALTALLCLSSYLLRAQCPDFTNLNDSIVTCHYGSTYNPFQNTGIAAGRHTLITDQDTDPQTGGQLPLLPPDESSVIKLGNEHVGAQAEAITYRFTVDGDHAILLLKFAVVLEDPGHDLLAQPRFIVRILDNAGNLTETCDEYDVLCSGNIPGFQIYTEGGHNVRWLPWTNVGLDLSRYIGQQVQVQFVTYDCDCYRHYGYAYFTASCISNRLAVSGCTGQQVTLIAPDNFESYFWSNNDTTAYTQYYFSGGNNAANCLITSATGCQFTLNAYISSNPSLPTADQTIYDTICQGESYSDNYFNLPAQNTPGNFTHVNSLYNPTTCNGNVTLTLFLTVLPSFEDIYDDICQGQAYTRNGFNLSATDIQNQQYLQFPEDIITFTRTDASGICDRIVTLHLTVNPALNMPQTILGNTNPCTGNPETYILVQGNRLSLLQWIVPDNVRLLSSPNNAQVLLYFDDNSPVSTVLTLFGQNGCGSGTATLTVTPHPSYHFFFSDTICTGNEYHEHGFDLPRQDSLGIYVYTRSLTTASGCDSTRILELTVVGSPTLTALAEPEMICNGQSTILHALGENAGFLELTPVVSIGDILCTDSSIVKADDWPVAGKTPMGVVFYVDSTKLHGWAVALKEFSDIIWGPNTYVYQNDDVPAITNYGNARLAMGDENGLANTSAIRDFYSDIFSNCQAAYRCYYYNHNTGTTDSTHFGWYLPAVGQLRKLFSKLPTIDATLTRLGTAAQQFNGVWYWSSSEVNNLLAWYVYTSGFVSYNEKYSYYYARPCRAF